MVGEDRVTIDYLAELPMADLVREVKALERRGGSADTYIDSQPRELRSGLAITLDGQPATLTDVPVEQLPSTARAMVVSIRMELPLDPGVSHDLQISNGNRPELPSYFCASATVAHSWLVPSTSLVGDKVWNGQWRMEEDARTVRIELVPRSGLSSLSGWLAFDQRPRPVEVAIHEGGPADLLRGGLPVIAVVVAVIGGLLARWRGTLK